MIIANPEVIIMNRIRHGLTQGQLAAEIGVAPSSVSRAEAAKGISSRTAKALCDFLKLDPLEVLKIGGVDHDADANDRRSDQVTPAG